MPRYVPHFVQPSRESVHLAIVYKNFGAVKGLSHIGLGVTALTNMGVLNAAGFWTEVWKILSAADLEAKLAHTRAHNLSHGEVPVSHVVVSAPWIPTSDLSRIASEYHEVDFTMTCHSNIGFLQADTNGIRLMREGADLQTGSINFHIGANTRRLIDWWESVYKSPMRYLPNLYDLTKAKTGARTWRSGNTLRIGSFGAVRPLKNILTAGAAALEIGTRLQADMEFWVSAKRVEGGGDTIMRALQSMYAALPSATLRYSDWQDWPAFRRTVRDMHLLIQPSYTESFSMVTADAIAEGVPVVVSDAIDWAPSRWVASCDDAGYIADVGVSLLHNPSSAQDGLTALKTHNASGLLAWSDMLLGN